MKQIPMHNKEGTLVINLTDLQTKNTVWKGVASDTIYDQP
jgi:hypothetical protein